MYHDPNLCKAIIEQDHITRISVHDLTYIQKYDRFIAKTPAEIITRLENWIATMDTGFAVKAWCEGWEDDSEGGRKSERRASYLWKFMGTKGIRGAMSQSEQGSAPAPLLHPSVTPVDPQWMKEYMEARVNATISAERLAMLKEKYDDGESDPDEEEEEEEEAPRRGGFGIRTDAPLFGMDPKDTFSLLERLLDTMSMRLPQRAMNGARREGAINGTRAAASGAISAEDARLLASVKEYERQHPDHAAAIRAQLDKYAPDA